jgi:hypothetical protein
MPATEGEFVTLAPALRVIWPMPPASLAQLTRPRESLNSSTAESAARRVAGRLAARNEATETTYPKGKGDPRAVSPRPQGRRAQSIALTTIEDCLALPAEAAGERRNDPAD